MKQLLLNAVLLAGCARTGLVAKSVPCETRCGLIAQENCAELQDLETEWVWEMAVPLEADTSTLCESFRGWVVGAHAFKRSEKVVCKEGWPLPISGTCVVGYTYEEARKVEAVGANWRQNALPHELVHVYEIVAHGHAGHCEWKKRGIVGALYKLTGELDWSASDCPTE